MIICHDKQAMRAHRRGFDGGVAFVPTMGALHDGHLALISHALSLAPQVIVSIFVNPMQFIDQQDYQRYPRDLDADVAKLDNAGVSVLFAPSAEDMYTPNAKTTVSVRDLADKLCGVFRAPHFDGVATVVTKLFQIVAPDIAIFGEKDFQQLRIIQTLARDLDMPVSVIGHPTVREADGLAMSSRNRGLNAAARAQAPQLYQTLSGIVTQLLAGNRDYKQLTNAAFVALTDAGFVVDYVEICDAQTLLPATPASGGQLLVCAAAGIGGVRLIDNICVTMDAVQSKGTSDQ